MNNSMIWLAVFVGALTLVSALTKGSGKKSKDTRDRDLRARRPLTAHEIKMFQRLRQALPEHVVLAQVSFSALLDTKNRLTRNTFSQKTADFVVCDQSMNVLAIVELDDSSHRNREKQDAARDELLTTVGYRVLRYPRLAEVTRIANDFKDMKA